MFQAPGDRRFALALAASLLLHGALLLLTVPAAAPLRPPAAVLHALLVAAPEEAEAPLPAVLHDTLSEEAPPAELPPAPLPARAAIEPARPSTEPPPPARAAGKPAEQLLYPPEAVAAGIQGEARVRITLDAGGAVTQASIARSSGHGVLDAAALRAVYGLERLPGAPAGELVLPVIFRLR
jgi:protein TonB